MAFSKPYVLFAPDLDEYERVRGFYIPYRSLSPYIAQTSEELRIEVLKALEAESHDWTEECYQYHLGACDGMATERILENLGL